MSFTIIPSYVDAGQTNRSHVEGSSLTHTSAEVSIEVEDRSEDVAEEHVAIVSDYGVRVPRKSTSANLGLAARLAFSAEAMVGGAIGSVSATCARAAGNGGSGSLVAACNVGSLMGLGTGILGLGAASGLDLAMTGYQLYREEGASARYRDTKQTFDRLHRALTIAKKNRQTCRENRRDARKAVECANQSLLSLSRSDANAVAVEAAKKHILASQTELRCRDAAYEEARAAVVNARGALSAMGDLNTVGAATTARANVTRLRAGLAVLTMRAVGNLTNSAMRLTAEILTQSGAASVAARRVLSAVPIVGLVVSSAGLLNGLATCVRELRQIREINQQRIKIADTRDAIARIKSNSDSKLDANLLEALNNVAHHAGQSLGKARTGSILGLGGAALGMGADFLLMTNSILTLTGVGAPLGLTISLIGVVVTSGGVAVASGIYALTRHLNKTKTMASVRAEHIELTVQDAYLRRLDNSAESTNAQEKASSDSTRHTLEGADMVTIGRATGDALIELSRKNRFFAAVNLIQLLRSRTHDNWLDSSAGKEFTGIMQTAGISEADVDRLYALACAEPPGPVGPQSASVQTLTEWFYR